MKNVIKILGVALIGILIYSCQKQDGTARMSVKMIDAPVNYDSVNVEIEQVQIHYTDSAGGSWIDLPTVAGIYNLLDLQNGVTAALVNNGDIPVGQLQQMRLILGDENTVVVDSLSYPLLLSSQDKTGLKVNVGAVLQPGDIIEITLDFDALKSIVVQGDGSYRLKPVVKLENVIYL